MRQSIYTDGGYLAHNPDWHAPDSPFKARWIRDVVQGYVGRVNSIAEVGCGAGQILVELQKLFPEASLKGFDISPQASALSAPKAGKGLEFFLQDFFATDGLYFDLLLAIDVLEHVPDYMSFIRAMKDRAAFKVFHIPLDLSVQGVLRMSGVMRARRELGHLHYFTKDTALATLSDCGHEIIHWRYTHGAEELPGRRLHTKMLNVPRKALRLLSKDFSARLLGGSSIMVLTR